MCMSLLRDERFQYRLWSRIFPNQQAKQANLSDTAGVKQDTLALLHELIEIAPTNLNRSKGGQQGAKHIAARIRAVLSLLQVPLRMRIILL